MADLIQQHFFRTDSLRVAGAIDISSYDLVGRYDLLGTADHCGATEIPQFVFLDGATAAEATQGKAVSVAFFGHGNLRVKVKGAVEAGDKLTTDSSGRIVASGTAQNAKLGSTDFAVAKEDGDDGDEVLIDVLRGGA